MTLQNLKNRKWNYVGLSFAFTFLAFFILMIVKGFVPFGDSSMLYSDAYHQYYPFFVAFRRALRSGESLLYSWMWVLAWTIWVLLPTIWRLR